MTREPIMEALRAALQAQFGASFKAPLARKLKHWKDVDGGDFPCWFLTQGNESPVATTRVPTIWSMTIDVYLYAFTGADSSITPMSYLNPLVDSITGWFEPTNGVEQTLGGLVHRCRNTGVETDAGVLGDHAVAIISTTLIVAT